MLKKVELFWLLCIAIANLEGMHIKDMKNNKQYTIRVEAIGKKDIELPSNDTLVTILDLKKAIYTYWKIPVEQQAIKPIATLWIFEREIGPVLFNENELSYLMELYNTNTFMMQDYS